ncbi:MAG: hypothetical protein U9R48_10310 [Chloroflexota bacterium]|nr:hypothetical protein [Chloroflexota bacterium]
MADFRRMYPDPKDFIDSTAATRVNGYLGGHGTRASLQRDLDSFGLSETAEEAFLREVGATSSRQPSTMQKAIREP